MKIELSRVSKRYRREWVVREVDLMLDAPGRYAVTGPNGSGKSTLLRILSGHLSPTKGQASFSHQKKSLNPNEAWQYLSYAAPYIELIEEFTLLEALQFHHRFRKFAAGLQPKDLVGVLGFPDSAANKPVRFFSSGMKQRLKLVLAICSETPLLLLDEPTSNLDRQGAAWYLDLIGQFAGDRLVVVASNVEEDYAFCTEYIDILQYKSKTKTKNIAT
ncbi:MAG: ATP-binding cassette domain-containing protein [Saprospiraceae bacterium]